MSGWLLVESAHLVVSSDVMLAVAAAAAASGQAVGTVIHRHGLTPHLGWLQSTTAVAHDARRVLSWPRASLPRATLAQPDAAVRHALRTTAMLCAAALGAFGLMLSTIANPSPPMVAMACAIALLLVFPAIVIAMARRSTHTRSVLSRRGPHLLATGFIQEAFQVGTMAIPVLVVSHTAGLAGVRFADVIVVALITRVVTLAGPVAGIGLADATFIAGLGIIGAPLAVAVAAALVWRAGSVLATAAAAGVAARSRLADASWDGPSVDGAGRFAHRAAFGMLAVLPAPIRDVARRAVFDALFTVSTDPWGYQLLPYEQRKQQHLLKAVDARAHVILEVGCADGHNLLALAKHCPEATVVGTDVAARALQLAQDRTAHLDRIRVVDARDEDALLNAVTGPVDCVVLAEVLYYLGGDRAMERAMSSVRALMHPGCRVVMVHGCSDASELHARAANALGLTVVSGVCVRDPDRPYEVAVAAAL